MNTPTTEGNRCKDARVRVCEGVMPLKKTKKGRDEVLTSELNTIKSIRAGKPASIRMPLVEEEDLFSNEKLERRKDFRIKKKMKKKNPKFSKLNIKPHSAVVYSDFISKISNLDKSIASEALESIVLTFLTSLRTSNVERALIISAKLLKAHLGISFSNIIYKILLCRDMSFIRNILPWSLGDLESYMKDLLNNWKVAHKNEAFASIVALISTYLAIFYSADKKWSISVGSFSLFLFEARNSCKGATNLVDAVLKVSTYVIGGLKKFLTTGSYAGFLYSDDQLGDLDSTVSKLQAQFKYVKPGNLGKFTGLDENTFDQELQLAIGSGEKLVLLYDGPTKKFVMDKIRMLRQLHCDFIQTRAAGGLRVAPFAYLLSGSTGLGKSSINEILMRYTLSVNGFNHQDPYIVTLNSEDKYFSSYRSYVNGVIFDDFANVNYNFVEGSPCDTLLKFVNNIPYYLNMAELELKGNVVAEPKIVGVTTNVSDLDSSIYSNQPSSIMRRLKVHICAKVRPEFQKDGTIEIDSSKVQAVYGDAALAPDIWLFDVFTVKVHAIPRPPKTDAGASSIHRDDKWCLEYVQWNGSDMKGANINELLSYMKDATALHFKEQNSLIERSKLFGGEIVCKQCSEFSEYCSCITPALGDATGDIHDLLATPDIFHDSLEIGPQSSISDTIYSKLFEARKKTIEQNLRDMLFSWVTEGKYNLESVCSDFIASCSQEIQYFLIVCRNLAEKWFKANRKLMIEMCFPHELENTRLGDYFSLIARSEEVAKITNISYFVESAFRSGLAFAVYSLHAQNKWYGDFKYVLPILGHYIISRMGIPFMVTRIYAEGIMCVKSSCNIANQFSLNTTRSAILIVCILKLATYSDAYFKGICQLLACLLMVVLPCFSSFKHISMNDAPRALSLLYKKEKEAFSSDWSHVAPSVLTMSTLYYSKDSIVDFYADVVSRCDLCPQSRLKPSPTEIAERDSKHKFDDAWFKNCAEPYLDPLPTSMPCTSQEVRNAISSNVWFVQNLSTNSNSNCLVLCSGCILIPYHYVPKSLNLLRFTRHNRGNKGNSTFESFVEPSQCIRIGCYDLALMWMPKTRDVRSLIEFFPTEFHVTNDKRCGRIATRDINGNLVWDDVRELSHTYSATSGTGYNFPGIFYIWNDAKEGKCLSPIVTDDKRACISGLHVGGSTQKRPDGGHYAFGVTPTQSDLLAAKLQLEKFATVIPMSSSGIFRDSCMDIEVFDRNIKKKSCYLRMEQDNSAYFFGSSRNCNRTPKSQVRDTPIKLCVKKLFGVEEEWGSPKFKGPDGHSPHDPWEKGMEKWIVDKPGLPFALLNTAKIDYSNNLSRIILNQKEYWSREIKVLSWDETVNGIPGKRFIDSMNFKSSIGFPFKGSKKIFSQNLGQVDGWQDKRILDPQFIKEAEYIESLYRKGERYYPWFISTLKDEPTLSTKDKVRVFQATSTPFQLVMRKYTLGICRFLQMNPLESECAVGIDPCSSEWNEMYQHLKGVQTPLYDRWFAIDYKAYDTSISSQVIMAIGRIFVDIAKIVGYSEDDINILYSIFTELSFSIVDFNGDVLMLDGANPSGNSLTVFINNLCNSLLMRIYFYHLYPRRKFSNYVRMMGYGDDLIAAVGAMAGKFTMKGYATYLKPFGFTVTPAQKDEELRCFSRLREIDFLKRKFIWSDEYNSIIAPLEELSIYKRLCNYMSSETSVEVIVGANIDGALDEWSFYGKTIYLDRQKKLIKIVEEFELHRFVHRLYMTFEQRVSLWKQQHAGPAVMGKGQSMDTDKSNCDIDWLGFFGWGNIISKMGIGGPPASHNSGSISSDDQMSINQRTNNTTYTLYQPSIVEAIKPLAAGELDLQKWVISPHSSTFSSEKHEILTLQDGSSNQIVDMQGEFEETRFGSDASDNSLAGFLARPVKIHSFDWGADADVANGIYPWSLFLRNKRVINRINNYKLFRGKLKLKILINGNSFYSGRLMAAFWPLDQYDSMTNNDANKISLTQFSQMPRVFLDPTTSQGGEMTIPFFWHSDYFDLVSNNTDLLGQLSYKTLNRLKHTNGDTSSATRVSVSVYAWLEDVGLEGPTATNAFGIIPQSSNPNSHATFAPYATGSSSFGRPSVNPDPNFLTPRGVGNMLLTDSHDTVNKLTLTRDQQVSLDPRILGLGNMDELDVVSIASRESYLTQFQWPLSASRDDNLFNIRVTPALWAKASDGGFERLQFTACCGAVLPFNHWNGTFKMRLQIVASAFHRGRLMVMYDPHTTPTAREDNVAYSQIIDIAECRDVTFKVGPNQDKSMLSYTPPTEVATSNTYGAVSLLHTVAGNGVIGVYVINELAVPNAAPGPLNDITINVFVSMDDDFQVYDPSINYSRYTIVPQSTGVDVSTEELDPVQESDPYAETALLLDQKLVIPSHRDKVFFGEKVTNFRQLLKRYYQHSAFIMPAAGAAAASVVHTHRIFPPYRGNVTGAVHVTGGAAPYNYFAMTMLNYLTPAFQAWRGSIRYKMFPRCGHNNLNGCAQVAMQYNLGYTIGTVGYDLSTPSKLAANALFSTNHEQRARGANVIVQNVNPTIEYEVPFFSTHRFAPGKRVDWTTAPATTAEVPVGAVVYIDMASSLSLYDVHVAAGEDFSLYFFTGWPDMYYRPTPPVA